jgi:hypothetical protein
MKTILLLGTACFAFVAAQNTAQASEKIRKNESYCLETQMGEGSGLLRSCSFETFAQCMASKVGQSDQCSLNPVLAFEQRNRH